MQGAVSVSAPGSTGEGSTVHGSWEDKEARQTAQMGMREMCSCLPARPPAPGVDVHSIVASASVSLCSLSGGCPCGVFGYTEAPPAPSSLAG